MYFSTHGDSRLRAHASLSSRLDTMNAHHNITIYACESMPWTYVPSVQYAQAESTSESIA